MKKRDLGPGDFSAAALYGLRHGFAQTVGSRIPLKFGGELVFGRVCCRLAPPLAAFMALPVTGDESKAP